MKLMLFFTPASSTLIKFFTSWLWQQLSSTSTGFPTYKSSDMASREDAQMTHYSDGLDCDLLVLSFIAPQTNQYTRKAAEIQYIVTFCSYCASDLRTSLGLGFGGLKFWIIYCCNKVALTSHWTTEGAFNRHYVLSNYKAWNMPFLVRLKMEI